MVDKLLYITGNYTIPAHSDFCRNIAISDGCLTVEEYGNVLNSVTVDGNVSMGNFAFIHKLHLLEHAEIFFTGENALICQLFAPEGLVVHVLPNCDWKKFVRFQSCGQVEIRQDIVVQH